MLHVSRQAVSKWESAQSIPDLKRIIEMADLFGVSTDYLLREEMESIPVQQNEENGISIRKVTMEQANEFLHMRQESAVKISRGVSLCILSPATLIFLSGFKGKENVRVAFGMFVLFVLVAIAVYSFISNGMKEESFSYLEKECFETEYGVTSLIKEKQKAFAPVFTQNIAVGVVLCILSALPLIVISLLEFSEFFMTSCVSIILILVSFGVNRIVKVSMIKGGYDMLLQEGDYCKEEKIRNKKLDLFDGAYWCLIVAIYLAISFYSNRWDRTWIIWLVAGVLFVTVRSIALIFMKDENKL